MLLRNIRTCWAVISISEIDVSEGMVVTVFVGAGVEVSVGKVVRVGVMVGCGSVKLQAASIKINIVKNNRKDDDLIMASPRVNRIKRV
jgi:hypothetical protein